MSRLARQFDARLAILVLFLGAAHCWTEHHVATKTVALKTTTTNDSLPLNSPSSPVCESSGCFCHGATLAATADVSVDITWAFLIPVAPNNLSGWIVFPSGTCASDWKPPVVCVAALEVCAQLQSFQL